jgi:hypothetical protein
VKNAKLAMGWFRMSKSGGPKLSGGGLSERKRAGLKRCTPGALMASLGKERRLTKGRRNNLGSFSLPIIHGMVARERATLNGWKLDNKASKLDYNVDRAGRSRQGKSRQR